MTVSCYFSFFQIVNVRFGTFPPSSTLVLLIPVCGDVPSIVFNRQKKTVGPRFSLSKQSRDVHVHVFVPISTNTSSSLLCVRVLIHKQLSEIVTTGTVDTRRSVIVKNTTHLKIRGAISWRAKAFWTAWLLKVPTSLFLCNTSK